MTEHSTLKKMREEKIKQSNELHKKHITASWKFILVGGLIMILITIAGLIGKPTLFFWLTLLPGILLLIAIPNLAYNALYYSWKVYKHNKKNK